MDGAPDNAIYTFRQGRIIDRSHGSEQYRASGLNLVIAAIVYWNTMYMDATVQHLRWASVAVPDDLLVHTSPLGWELAFSGDFLWDSPDYPEGLPLRRPDPNLTKLAVAVSEVQEAMKKALASRSPSSPSCNAEK